MKEKNGLKPVLSNKEISFILESSLFESYCENNTGYIFSEVSIGCKKIFGKYSNNRRLDIVRIGVGLKKEKLKYSDNKELFQELLYKSNDIEIVEIKTKLNRTVIGQIMVGEYMFKEKFCVKDITKAILYINGDEALEKYCILNGIKLLCNSIHAENRTAHENCSSINPKRKIKID